MKRRRPGCDAALLLPDNWPKTRLNENVSSGVCETLQPGSMRSPAETWPRIAIIARDPFATIGIRYLLTSGPSVWLRTYDHVPAESALKDVDVVIWLRMHHDGLPDLAGHVVSLCRLRCRLKQLVISDLIPTGIPPGPGPLSGVWISRANECREMLSAMLRVVIRAPPPSGSILAKRLGRMQWRVLLLRAAGMDTSSIAQACGISIKTVSVHESALRERLGVSGRAEYAWLLRSVKQMQKVLPILGREVRYLKNNAACEA